MKNSNSQLTSSILLVFLVMVPGLSFANDSWTGFVPPSSSKSNVENSDNSTKWRKGKWRTGVNYNTPQRFKFNSISPNDTQGNEYALTEPQRKSVNPWLVNKTSTKYYKFGPTKRPWGSVPEGFNKRNSQSRNNFNQPVNNAFPVPQRVYRPYANNFTRVSNSLLPIGGYLPFYSNSSYMNPLAFNNRQFAYQPVGLWR